MQQPSLMIEDNGLLVTASAEESEQLVAFFSRNGIACQSRPGPDEQHFVEFGPGYDLEQIVRLLASWTKREPDKQGGAP